MLFVYKLLVKIIKRLTHFLCYRSIPSSICIQSNFRTNLNSFSLDKIFKICNETFLNQIIVLYYLSHLRLVYKFGQC